MCVQSIKLLLMHGAQAHHENRHKQVAERLCTDSTCLQVFEQLRKDGDLCRQDLREHLADCRAAATDAATARAAAATAACVPLPLPSCVRTTVRHGVGSSQDDLHCDSRYITLGMWNQTLTSRFPAGLQSSRQL